MIFRLLLIVLLIVCIAWPLYKLLLRCFLGVKKELDTGTDEDLEYQIKLLKDKNKKLGRQCAENINAATKQIKVAQRVKRQL